MVDHQRIIDTIRGLLASSPPPLPTALSSAAGEFAEACDRVNDRLRACGELLRESLRSEAIQQCEVEPNLLNLLATLDFPELPAWSALLQSVGLAPPPPLLVDVAAELNEAYALEQPLAALLKRHRLQALARSPLRDRLGTLRKLVAIDANNLAWRDDLRLYEQARMQEIGLDVDREYKAGNVALLKELVRDVQSDQWCEPPPPTLVQQVTGKHTRAVRKQSRSELEQLAPELNDAFGQFDVARGRALRQRWRDADKLASIAEDDPLVEGVNPALEWLEREDRTDADAAGYASAVAELERALDDGDGLSSLDRKAHAILRFDRPIPPVLEQRLRTRIAALELAHSRRVRMVVGAVLLLVAITASGLGLLLAGQRYAQQVSAHAATIQALIDKREYANAREHLDQLNTSSPSIAADPAIQELDLLLTGRVHVEQDRLAQFTAAVEAAEKAGAESPDRDAFERARGLALKDAEKTRVLQLEGAIKSAERRQQSERDKRFEQKVNDISKQIDAIDNRTPDAKAAANAREALAALVTDSGVISPAVMRQSKIQEARLDALNKTIRAQQGMTAALATIERSVSSADSYRQALEQFIAEIPESGQAIDFKRALGELPFVGDVAAWNRFVARWLESDVSHLSVQQAREVLDASSSLLRDHGGHPAATELKQRFMHLEAITRRSGEGGRPLYSPLHELFTDPLVAGLWLIETNDGMRYYLATEPPSKPQDDNSFQVSYIVDFSRSTSHKKRIKVDTITFKGVAPQAVLAKSVMDEIVTLNKELWEPVFVKIIRRIQTDAKTDPILKVLFLQKVVEVAGGGSESLRLALVDCREVLGSMPSSSAVRWMDSSDDTVRVRNLAEDLLKRLPALDKVGQDAAASLKAFKAPLAPRYDWIGWLSRDAHGVWQCSVKDLSRGDCGLFVAVPAAEEKKFEFVSIGSVKRGKVNLDTSNPIALLQGRPVFAEKLSAHRPSGTP